MACVDCSPDPNFYITVPGVPTGRRITPLVRINGQVQELPVGMVIPFSAIDTSSLLAAMLANETFLTDLKAALALLP